MKTVKIQILDGGDSLVIDRFRRELIRNGYHETGNDRDEKYLFFTTGGEEIETIYIVLIWDLSELGKIEREQYEKYIRMVKASYYRSFEKVSLLNILFTNEVEKARELCDDWNEHWIFHIEENKLIVYENQIGTFLNVRDLLEGSIKPKSLMSYPICTISIIAINVVVFVLVELTGGSLDTEHMYEWGAMYWPSVVENKQYYRIFTHFFLHFGLDHLANNMIVFGYIGSILERIIGKGRFLVIYFTSGILAGIASMGYNMFQGRIVVAAGASGAIFGVVGAMLYILIINRGRVVSLSLRQLILFGILSLYTGLTSQGVDNTAHIGGLLSGCIMAIFLTTFVKFVKQKRKI